MNICKYLLTCRHLPPLCVSHTCRYLEKRTVLQSEAKDYVLLYSVCCVFVPDDHTTTEFYKNAPGLINIGNGISTLVFQVLASYR